jgi:hypothetical protein
MTTIAPATAPTTTRTHDARRFWMTLLAVVAPLPMLSKGIYYLIVPVDGDASFDATVRALQSRPHLNTALVWLDVVFCTLLVPSLVAGCWLARRAAPRLTAAAGLVAVGGALAGQILLGGPMTPFEATLRHGVDPQAMKELMDASETDPVFVVGIVCFLGAIVIGLSLLGAALWRSGEVPRVAALAVIVGGATHPFLPGHLVQGVGLLAVAAGFVFVSVGLLRLPKDAFDLPPLQR